MQVHFQNLIADLRDNLDIESPTPQDDVAAIRTIWAIKNFSNVSEKHRGFWLTGLQYGRALTNGGRYYY